MKHILISLSASLTPQGADLPCPNKAKRGLMESQMLRSFQELLIKPSARKGAFKSG